MIRWQAVVVRQLWWLLFLGACWSQDLVMGDFTPAQWQAIRDSYVLRWQPRPIDSDKARLGQQLFYEAALSGPNTLSCATCHVADWYIDTRPANDVSAKATGFTKHNTLSVVDLAIKDDLAPAASHLFTWTGACANRPCTTPEMVITDIALPAAMASTPALVDDFVAGQPDYAALRGPTPGDTVDRVASALVEYMRELVSIDAPFDRFVAGDDTALDASATRGFALFVGRAMCSECHRGPLLTDYDFHITGVAQAGLDAPVTDDGHDGTGGFYTAPLRHVAKTGPYMHDGSLHTLADVVDFYRRGGDGSGYTGTKDPRIVPLDLSDEEAQDLEAFLHALTGTTLPACLGTRGCP